MTQFDKNIKHKLESYESHYSEEMWQRIASQLPEKKRRVPPFWILSTIITTLFIVSAASVFWYFQKNSSGEIIKNNISKPEKAQAVNFHNSSQINEPSTVSPTIFSNTTGDSEVHKSIDQQNLRLNIEKNVHNKPKSLANTKPSYKSSISQSNSLADKKYIKNIQNDLEIHSPSPQGLPLEDQSNSINLQPSQGFSSLTIDIRKSVNAKFSGALREIMQGKEMEEKSPISFEDRQDNEAKYGKIFVSPLGRKEVVSGFISKKMRTKHINDIKKSMTKALTLECPTFIHRRALPGLTLYYNNEMPFRFMSKKVDTDSPLLMDRNNSESFIYSYSSGLLFDIYKVNRTIFQLGVNYSQINQKFEFSTKNTSQIKTIKVVDYILVDDIIVDSVVTEEKITVPGTLEITHQNKFKSVDIPILVNYQIARNGRWSFSASGGALVNLLFTQEGRILSGNKLYPESIGNGTKENPYKSNAGISLLGSINMQYQLLPNLDVIVAPMARYNVHNLTKTDYSLNEKFIVAGIMTGLKINL